MITESVGGMNVNKLPGREVIIESRVFLSLVGKCTNCSSPKSFIISIKISPSDRLNGELIC